MTLKTLRHLSTTLHETDAAEDEKSIDYSSVGLYLSGLQLVFTVVCCACASVLSCWLIPSRSGSAVRTLVITSTVGMVLVRKPLRIGRVRGVNTLFNALRPCVVVYIVALVIEQLIHTCVSIDEAAALDDNNLLKSLVYHATSGLLVVGGFIRATSPRKETDWPFLLSTSCLLLLAIYPPQALVHSGPLCAPTTLLGAGERVLRSLLFSCLYVVLVYSAAPSRNVSNELFICVGRATAASVWVLAVTPWILPLAPLQVAIALFARLRDTSDAGHESTDTFESLPLRAPGSNSSLEPHTSVHFCAVRHTAHTHTARCLYCEQVP